MKTQRKLNLTNSSWRLSHCLTTLLLMVWLPIAVQAAPSSLDFSFGNGGIVVTPITSDTWLYDNATSMVVQPDGKIVVCGQVIYEDAEGSYPVSFFLARYNPTGSLDISFGTNGKVLAPIGGSNSGIYGGQGMALQPDGKIVTVGFYFGTGGGSGFAVYRYNADGTLDASFGAGGRVTTLVGIGIGAADDVAVQPDGKIVVSGHASMSGQDYSDFAVVRYNPNGSLDTSFGAGGKAIVPVGKGNAYDESYAVVLQMDGKIVVAGTTTNFVTNNDYALIRLNADGSLDAGFGTNGKIIYVTPASGVIKDVVVQPDGKIVAAGGTYFSNYDTAIFRFNPNGSTDTSFAANGIFTPESSFYVGNSVALQPDGKIVAFGAGQTTGSQLSGFAVARLNPNGSPDATFGVNGRKTTLIGTYNNSGATAGAIQSDGKILAFGYTYHAFGNDIAFVRYHDDFAASRPTKFDFDGDGKADVSVFRPSDGFWYLNRSTEGFSGNQLGLSTDKITPADYDGDRKTDIAVFREGVWYLLRSNLGFTAFNFGTATDIPVPADYDADSKAEIAVFRPSNGNWYIYNLATNQATSFAFGQSGDIPVAADYDGDGKVDVAVYRQGIWYLQRSSLGFTGIAFGATTDKPVPADYDGDGKTDIAVFRPDNGVWYLLRSNLGFTGVQFGLGVDKPVPADYDGDGKSDVAVFRNGNWYLSQSTNGWTATQFGLNNDIPVPSAFIP